MLHLNIDIKQECMFVCLFVCPIITHDSLDRFASNCDKVTRQHHGNALNLCLQCEVEWVYSKGLVLWQIYIYICINQHICVYCSVYANQNWGKYPKDKSKRRRTSISVDSNPKLSWSHGLNEVHLDIERCHKYVQQIKMPNARLHKFYSPFFCMIVSLTAVDQRFSFKSSEISIFIQNIIPANKTISIVFC